MTKAKAKTTTGPKTKAIMPKVIATSVLTVGGREFTEAELEAIIQSVNDKPTASSVETGLTKPTSTYDQSVSQVEEMMARLEMQVAGLISDIDPALKPEREDADVSESEVCVYGDAPINQYLYRVASKLESLKSHIASVRNRVEL